MIRYRAALLRLRRGSGIQIFGFALGIVAVVRRGRALDRACPRCEAGGKSQCFVQSTIAADAETGRGGEGVTRSDGVAFLLRSDGLGKYDFTGFVHRVSAGRSARDKVRLATVTLSQLFGRPTNLDDRATLALGDPAKLLVIQLDPASATDQVNQSVAVKPGLPNIDVHKAAVRSREDESKRSSSPASRRRFFIAPWRHLTGCIGLSVRLLER